VYVPAYAQQPAPMVAPAPAYVAAPVAMTAPAAQNIAPAPYNPAMDQRSRYAAQTADLSRDEGSIGLEGFWDNYKEDAVDLDSEAIYGSVTGSYQSFFSPQGFFAVDGRVSYGEDHYKSPTGNIKGIPQWEFDTRTRLGVRIPHNGSVIDLYSGLGARYYRDEFKGYNDTVGGTTYMGYDRRILQFYLPVGITHRQTLASGWSIRQNYEADALLWGNVSSRLENTGIPGLQNVENRQDAFSGFGLRAEVMFGQLDTQGRGFEFGPFVRYWYVDDSNLEDFGGGQQGLEPENTRLQLGAAVKYQF